MTTLSEVTPKEFSQSGEYDHTKAYKMRYETIVKTNYSDKIAWPGNHKNVSVWWELLNGYAVGWNENPSRGWSFPVVPSV